MVRFSPLVSVVALSLFALTACAPVGRQVMGDPQDPYPLTAPPRIGQIVHLPTGTLVSPAQMLAVATDARIVYVGETHDNPASHRLELQVLQALAERYPGRLALGMEMFVRSQQPALDRWVAGELDEKAFLKESRWFENWNMDFAYYRDLLNLARERHLPVIALDAEKSLVKAVRSTAPEQLGPAERAQLPELDLTDPYQRGLVTAIFGDHSHGGMAIDGFIRAQTLRDETMAESAARYLASPAGRDKHLLVVAGGDHVSSGFGIPRRVFRRLPASSVIIGGKELDIPPDKQDRLMNVTVPDFPMVPYDFLVYQAYEDLPETGLRLGVMIEPAPGGRGLAVKGVLPGSNAERAGLQPGDILLALDGEPLTGNFDLTYAVQRKHPGDRGVVLVERQGKSLKQEIVFLAPQKGQHHGSK
ncbi:PDZ domain-containing protein [Oryzomonas japonica]|uniref:PDZ domain-containing protein n=1 Tax=Oryzomonas japonica TaxID=2603858 RepID=A0A7J4ZSJ4_9BACT|nr:ChaN family lipoprotein [Oryzomonas japonica]KAB0666043.1 PDZ domain-containing protein [Oryzomonas japonica]